MTEPRAYGRPASFRRALTDKLKALAESVLLLPVARTLDGALETVRPFADPLLDGTAQGSWRPDDHRWER